MKILPQLSWLWRKMKFGGELLLFQCDYDKALRVIGLRAVLGWVPASEFGAQSFGLAWDLKHHHIAVAETVSEEAAFFMAAGKGPGS